MVERQLPKLDTRVRFPSPAPAFEAVDFIDVPQPPSVRFWRKSSGEKPVCNSQTGFFHRYAGLLAYEKNRFLKMREAVFSFYRVAL
jgi:hypothetical protein